MSIQFLYIYRDAGNFKNFGEIIFDNPNNVALDELSARLTLTLLDEMFFDAFAVGIPTLFFDEYDEELDHDWHEFSALAQTAVSNTDHRGRTIENFIVELSVKKLC